MKKVLVVILIAAFAIPVMVSCKKGANDPSISLKSRKARLVGEWSLTEGTITRTVGGTPFTFTYNGTTANWSGGGGSGSYTYTEKIEVVKDGTYTITVNDDGDLTVEEGQWYFMSGNKDKDVKNKECVGFVRTSVIFTPSGGSGSTTTTYVGVTPSWVAQLDKLSSKELIVIIDESETATSTDSRAGTMTYEK